MDYAALAQLILAIFTEAPALIGKAKALYDANRANFAETDQAKIDAAYAASITSDEAKTAAAVAALDEAAKNP